jgi:predicted metalloprotease
MGILLLLAVLIFGGDPIQLLSMLGGGGGSPMPDQRSSSPPGAPASDEEAQFVSSVLGFTEDTWSDLFRRGGQTYQPPKLVLYSGATTTACGYGSGASGPFYCPGDRKVYIDLDFFRELNRLGAPGDFAQAYVIAHEVAHHVQNLLGTMQKVDKLRRGAGQADANALSVRLELQADCYAGIWTHHAQKAFDILERGDIREGLGAAAAVGDDRLQRRSGRGVHPESFTHGSSEQRVKWFSTGLETGDIAACNTFV